MEKHNFRLIGPFQSNVWHQLSTEMYCSFTRKLDLDCWRASAKPYLDFGRRGEELLISGEEQSNILSVLISYWTFLIFSTLVHSVPLRPNIGTNSFSPEQKSTDIWITTLLKAVLKEALLELKKSKFFKFWGCSKRFSVFSIFGQNEPKVFISLLKIRKFEDSLIYLRPPVYLAPESTLLSTGTGPYSWVFLSCYCCTFWYYQRSK